MQGAVSDLKHASLALPLFILPCTDSKRKIPGLIGDALHCIPKLFQLSFLVCGPPCWQKFSIPNEPFSKLLMITYGESGTGARPVPLAIPIAVQQSLVRPILYEIRTNILMVPIDFDVTFQEAGVRSVVRVVHADTV